MATDAPETEYNELKRHLADLDEGVEVHRYAPPSQAIKDELKDGGVAIVDQIICSHARSVRSNWFPIYRVEISLVTQIY